MRTDPFYYIDDSPFLSPENTRHCLTILRREPGEMLEVSDGKGHIWEAHGVDLQGDRLQIRKGDLIMKTDRSRVRLATAVSKGQRMATLVEKCAELGARDIQPVICDRSSVRKITMGMLERWRRIARSAGHQSRNPWLCDILPALSLEELLNREENLGVLDPCGDSAAWKQVGGGETWTLLIGPEGGWTVEEQELFKRSGSIRLKLTDQPLRIETAAITALAFYHAHRSE